MLLATTALQIDTGPTLFGDMFAAFKIVLFVVVLATIALVIIRRLSTSDTYNLLCNLFIVSFVVRLLSSLFLLRIVPHLFPNDVYLSRGFINDDGILFDMIAQRGTDAMRSGMSPYSTFATGQTGALAYLLLMSITYLVIGHELLAIQVLNSFFGSLVPVFGFLIAQQIMPFVQARYAAIFMVFYPEQIIYSGSHQKDMSIVCTFIVGLWLVTRLFQNVRNSQRAWYIGFLIVLCGYLVLARIYYAALLGVAVFAMVGLENIRRLSKKQLLQGTILLVVMMAMMLLLVTIFLPRALNILLNPVQAIRGFYQIFTGGSNREGSLYALFRFPYNIILFPLVLLGFLLNPFILWPIIAPSPIYTLLVPTILVWYSILPFIVYGFATSNQPGVKRMLFLIVCGATFVLIITGSGLTTGGRSKLPLHPYAIMYAVIGIQAFRENKPWIRWLTGTYAGGLISMCALYSLLKLSVPNDLLVMALMPNIAIVGMIGLALWQRNRSRVRAEAPTGVPERE